MRFPCMQAECAWGPYGAPLVTFHRHSALIPTLSNSKVLWVSECRVLDIGMAPRWWQWAAAFENH